MNFSLWSLPSDLEMVTLRWFRDGLSAAGYSELQTKYTSDELRRAERLLVRSGLGQLDEDVDYDGERWVVDATLTATGRDRLAELEASAIVRRRRGGSAARWLRFAKENQWIVGAIGGAAVRPWLDQLWHFIHSIGR